MTITQSMPAHGEAHVWYGDTEVLVDPLLAQAYRVSLSDSERDRESRFQFDTDRRQFLFAHALLRAVLSRYLGCGPRAIEFGRNFYGKPTLVYPKSSGLEFNISHTSGLAVCAVGNGCHVGVDVERAGRDVDALALARRYFSKFEYEQLASVPAANRRQLFYRLWTLKESYIKARGIGLSIPLADFSFDFSASRSPAISFSGTIVDSPSDWHFSSVELTEHHHAALALHVPQGTWLGCRWREMASPCISPIVPCRVTAL
jgi:4'-phosphopantetheinyl transferase